MKIKKGVFPEPGNTPFLIENDRTVSRVLY